MDRNSTIGLLIFLLLVLTTLLFLIVKRFYYLKSCKNKNKLVFLDFLLLLSLSLIVLQKLVRDAIAFFFRFFYQTIRNEMGAGITCGFISAATIGYIFYIVLVPRLFFDNFEDSFFLEHHQKRVGAIISFVSGQLLKFCWFYNRPFYELLFQRNFIILFFLVFLIGQIFWTYLTIVRNWRFLYPRDKRKRVVRRVLLLQLEFCINFFMQLNPSDSRIEKPESMVCRLVDRYMSDKGKNILFVRCTFIGWWIGHIVLCIFYMKLFEFIVAWVRVYIKYLNSKNSKGNGEWDFFI